MKRFATSVLVLFGFALACGACGRRQVDAATIEQSKAALTQHVERVQADSQRTMGEAEATLE